MNFLPYWHHERKSMKIIHVPFNDMEMMRTQWCMEITHTDGRLSRTLWKARAVIAGRWCTARCKLRADMPQVCHLVCERVSRKNIQGFLSCHFNIRLRYHQKSERASGSMVQIAAVFPVQHSEMHVSDEAAPLREEVSVKKSHDHYKTRKWNSIFHNKASWPLSVA